MVCVATVDDLQQAVAHCAPGRRLLPVAGGTKPALSSSTHGDVDGLDVSGIRGVVDYDPAELTITAYAGTPVAEVGEVLAEHQQYLPFDPPLALAGATLGGVVAAGASGSNALRHGGVRDFVIGLRFVEGTGRVVAGGGKVVKNAAGFDLPKLMVGSLGRLGVMVQLSFKVLPRPRATRTLELGFGETARALAAACWVVRGPRQIDAVDILPGGRLLVRLGGDSETLTARSERLAASLNGASSTVAYEGAAEEEIWADAAEFRCAGEGTAAVVRVPLTAHEALSLEEGVIALGGTVRFTLAANVALVALDEAAATARLDRLLKALGLTGMVLRGARDAPLLGSAVGAAFGARVRQALDPHNRFLEF